MADEIARRKQAEKVLRKTERELTGITANIAEGIYVLGEKGRTIFMNPEAERLLGWTMDELNEKGTHNTIHYLRADGTPLPLEECNMFNVIRSGKRFYSRDEVFVRKDGTVFPISVISAPIMEDGKIVASITAFQDITELKQAENKLREISLTDELTGVYNRRGFFSLIEPFIRIAKRQEKRIFLLYADVDKLKHINDRFGHKEGDTALRECALILKETFRESDIIARIGGDEFAVISLEACQADMHGVLSRLRKNLEIFNAKKNSNYALSMSWGIAFCDPEKLCSLDDLLFQADKLMYEHKRSKNRL